MGWVPVLLLRAASVLKGFGVVKNADTCQGVHDFAGCRLAGVYLEKILKQTDSSIWMRPVVGSWKIRAGGSQSPGLGDRVLADVVSVVSGMPACSSDPVC